MSIRDESDTPVISGISPRGQDAYSRSVRRGCTRLALLALGLILAACAPSSSGGSDQLSSAPPQTANSGDASSVQQSIGDIIVGSSLISTGTVVGFGSPVWNSPDGSDWRDDYYADPSTYMTIPLEATPTTIRVDDVLSARDAPSVQSGDEIVVMFVDPHLVSGDQRVWFLQWTKFYLSDGSSQTVWYGDDNQHSWLISGNTVSPANDGQGYSLAEGAHRGLVAANLTPRGTGQMPLPALRGLINAELATTKVDVAGFDRWPPDPAYERAVADDDLPEEVTSSPSP
jgi:hypothetical protein